MLPISFETSELLLRIAFLIGAFTDFLAIFPLIFKGVRSYIFGTQATNHDRRGDYSMSIGVSLMTGWTILLFWGSLMPMERKDILTWIIHLSFVSIFYFFTYFNSMQFTRRGCVEIQRCRYWKLA